MPKKKYNKLTYLNCSNTNPGTDIFQYWKNNFDFPRLHKLSLKYHRAPLGIVFSEKLFSTSGLVVDKKKKQIKPQQSKNCCVSQQHLNK